MKWVSMCSTGWNKAIIQIWLLMIYWMFLVLKFKKKKPEGVRKDVQLQGGPKTNWCAHQQRVKEVRLIYRLYKYKDDWPHELVSFYQPDLMHKLSYCFVWFSTFTAHPKLDFGKWHCNISFNIIDSWGTEESAQHCCSSVLILCCCLSGRVPRALFQIHFYLTGLHPF